MRNIAIAVKIVTLQATAGFYWLERHKAFGKTAMVAAISMMLVLVQYEPAAAQNLDALQNAADRLVQFFTGPFGRSVGAIAFIGMFLAAAFGYWSWGALLRVGGSLAGMFAAAELVDFLAGGA